MPWLTSVILFCGASTNFVSQMELFAITYMRCKSSQICTPGVRRYGNLATSKSVPYVAALNKINRHSMYVLYTKTSD